jgi:hypothetical protein
MVTAPDDSFVQGVRVLLFDLTPDQYSTFSRSLLDMESVPSVVIYNASVSSPVSWIIDKLLKSDLIIFNAESDNQQLVGYLCSRKESYYFGILRDLSLVNNSVLFDVPQLKEILERLFETHGKF